MSNFLFPITKSDISIERAQLIDEGVSPEMVSALLDDYLENDADTAGIELRNGLMDAAALLPRNIEREKMEPSDLESIKKQRSATRVELPNKDLTAAKEKLSGAWYGRICGCLLGKPVEGWKRGQLEGFLKETGQYPLSFYIKISDDDAVNQQYKVETGKCFLPNISGMPPDDDTNYTVLSLLIAEKRGLNFSPEQVMNSWHELLPYAAVCTAEHNAYRNAVVGLTPPETATYKNPTREWIGAQIRTDFWGYVTPGKPELGAELAWRDARISHIKNGIYGAMFVSAVLSAAWATDNIETAILAGLGEIPEHSRLSQAIKKVIAWRREGISWETAVERIHQVWDESKFYHWCHTISNAEIVTAALLWGEGDYAKSICLAVSAGLDTDCNGATVGSIVGLMYGLNRIPANWLSPLNDTLYTSLAGYGNLSIRDLVERSLRFIVD